MKRAIFVASWSIFLLSAACSDDTGEAARDQGLDLPVPKDFGADSRADQRLDGLPPAPEAGQPEAGVDAHTDQRAPDSGRDQALGDGPVPALWGTVTRSVTPVLDGKGTLYIGVVNPLFGTPLVIQGTDLSQPGSSVHYQFNWLDPGDYELWAFLDDNNDANFLLLGASPGDLTLSAVIPISLGSSSMRLDVVLDAVAGVAPDAGVNDASLAVGAIRGQVRNIATGPGDSQGVLYASLHSELPPAGQVAQAAVYGVDLSSSYSSAVFYVGNVAPGSYYLRVFLDDNLSVGLFVQDPDTGDLIHDTIPVHIVGGATVTQDVVLNEVVP